MRHRTLPEHRHRCMLAPTHVIVEVPRREAALEGTSATAGPRVGDGSARHGTGCHCRSARTVTAFGGCPGGLSAIFSLNDGIDFLQAQLAGGSIVPRRKTSSMGNLALDRRVL